MKALLLIVGLVGSLAAQDMTDRILQKEAQTQPLSLPPRKERQFASFKQKFKAKPTAKKEQGLEFFIIERLQLDIPSGFEINENLKGGLALTELFEVIGELNVSEKYTGNRKKELKDEKGKVKGLVEQDDLLTNKIKYNFGFCWKSANKPIQIEWIVENLLENSFEVQGFKPQNFKMGKNNGFDKATVKLKIAY